MIFKHFSDIGRNAPCVVIVPVGLIKKFIRKRNQHFFRHQLHEHIFRRAYNIIHISQSEHVVEIFVRSER